MQHNEFVSQMSRLKETFTDRAYPDERTKLIWKEMQHLLLDEFRDIVSELIASCATAPMIGKFRESAFDLRRKNSIQYDEARESWIIQQPACSICDKKGYILARKKDDLTDFAFRCSCSIGASSFPRYPIWEYKWTETMDVNKVLKPSETTAPIKTFVSRLANKIPDFKSIAAGDKADE